MRITFCGTGAGGGISRERACSAIHLSGGGARLLLDCGPGFLERMVEADLDPDGLAAVVYSHLHFDHAMGIVELFCRVLARSGPPPSVYGPRDTDAYIESAVAFARQNATRPQLQEWLDGVGVELTRPGDEREIGPFAVRSVEVPHAPYLECLARRFELGGRALVYSGDTSYAPEALAPLADGADLLIHEAYTHGAVDRLAERNGMSDRAREAMRAGVAATHSQAEEAGRIAQAAGVQRLALTHLLPTETEPELLAAASAAFDGEIIVARDGLALEV